VSLETETSFEFVDTEVPVVSFPLQHPKGDQAPGHVVPLRPLRTRLTAGSTQVILTHAHDFLALGAETIPPAHLYGREGQAIGGIVLGAVADDQPVQASSQPASCRPGGMAPIGPKRGAIESAILFKTADNRPAIVPNPLQEGFGGLPGVKEHVVRGTAPAIAGLAEPG
jgi:hypothetical protein